MRTILAVLCLLHALSAAAHCSLSLGVSRTKVRVPTTQLVEDRIITIAGNNAGAGYVSGTYEQKNTSNVPEVDLDCTLWKTKGWGTFLTKFGLVEEFTDKVKTNVQLDYGGYHETFTVDRVVRARGYLALAGWEAELVKRVYGSFGLGGMYTRATADFHPLGSEYSLHAERSAWIPVLEGNVRWHFNRRSSVVFTGRSYGHPTDKERQVVGFGLYWRYAFD